jgi:glycosyltransferase involved in cell wall biosynthesis
MMTFPEDSLALVREVPASTRTLLSIVVCAYRHADYVGECLATIDTFAAPDVELIVIDDGSPDDTLRVCRDHVFDPQLPLRVYTKKNAGLIDSLRRGLALARGEHVAFIGSDDAYVSAGMAELMSRLRAGTWRGDATLCQGVRFGDVEEVLYDQGFLELFELPPEALYRRCATYLIRGMYLQTAIFRTAFLRGLDPWGRNFALDDWPTFVLVFGAGAEGRASVRYEPGLSLLRYRIHGGGAHKNLTQMIRTTEQIARELVPPKWRRLALANVRIQFGLTYLYQRNIRAGLAMCGRGLMTCPTPEVVARVAHRGASFIWKRLSRRSATVGGA